MRLFFATPADPPTTDAALAAIDRLRRGTGQYRWAGRADLHLTLSFLGERSDAERPELEALLRRVADRTPPFDIVYGSIGAFDSLDDARVIWLGVDEGTDRLADVAAALGRDEPRPFRAHLSLGFRRGSAIPSMGPFLRAQPALNLRRPVTSLALFASRPRGEQPPYQRLLEVPLRG